MPDSYTPQFQHTNWKDNVDLVSAEDPLQGFNKRFNDLRQELETLARIIGQINNSLTPSTSRVTFAPSFLPEGSDIAWTLTSGIAAKGNNQARAVGWLAAQLPQNSRMQSITIFGDKTGNVGVFQIQLIRQSFSGGLVTILTLDLATQADTFQANVAVPSINNLVDNQTNKYLITAKVVGADPVATVRIFAIQFLCNQA
jgi:hypothetical protein